MKPIKTVQVLSVICSIIFLAVYADTTINLTDDETHTVWKPTTTEKLTVLAGEGYRIGVNITHCSLDGEKGDFVKISNVVDEFYADDYTKIMFSYVCVTNLSYIYESNQITAQYEAADKASTFRAIFSRVGDGIIPTTTQIPTSTVYLPTPSEEAQADILVYIYGAKPEVFNTSQVLESLKGALANMAIEYTSVNNFPLNGSISASNVIIKNLEECHVTWEDYDTCTQLNLSIPINLLKTDPENTRWDGYQLDENHLRLMWTTYASTYIPKIGLQLYPVPNIDGIYKLRLIVTVSVVVTFAIAMLATLKCVLKRIDKQRKSQLADQMSIVDTTSIRPSETSMTPHYLQETPPWENEAPTFPSQGYHNLSFEPDNQYEEYEDRMSSDLSRLSPGPGQESNIDLVDLGGDTDNEEEV